MTDEHDEPHEHDHEHGDDHEHDHEHGHEHDPDAPAPGFDEVVGWLSQQSAVSLAEEGEHPSVVFLGFSDGRVSGQAFDATEPDEIDDEWNRIATWAGSTRANAVYFIAEAQRIDDENEDDVEDVLVFSALSSDGREVAVETPFTRDDEGKVTLGEIRHASAVAVHFNEFRELWGLPLLGDEHNGGAHDEPPAAA